MKAISLRSSVRSVTPLLRCWSTCWESICAVDMSSSPAIETVAADPERPPLISKLVGRAIRSARATDCRYHSPVVRGLPVRRLTKRKPAQR